MHTSRNRRRLDYHDQVGATNRAKQAIRETSAFPILKEAQERLSPARRAARHRRIELYRQFIGPGQLVFDVGANMGNRSEPLLSLGARVLAVEPQPVCIATLRRRFGSHRRFTLLPVGLGAAPGTATLHLATNHVTSSMSREFIDTMEFENSNWVSQVDVRISTLDILIDLFGLPDFCKVDVEGYEVEVLKGLSQPIPLMSLEYTPGQQLAEASATCLEILGELAEYEYAFSPGESMRWSHHGWMDLRTASELARESTLPFGDFYARSTTANSPGLQTKVG